LLTSVAAELRLFTTNFKPLPYDPLELFAYGLLGILCGLLGALFVLTLKHLTLARRTVSFLKDSRYGQVLAITLACALLTFPIDFLREGQKEAVNRLFNDEAERAVWDWDSAATYLNLFIYIIYKFLFTVICVGLPIGAGIFTPCFALGAGVGRLMGEIMHSMLAPAVKIVPGGYAVVGAAALASGVTRTFSTAVIVFELTGQLNHMLPVLVC